MAGKDGTLARWLISGSGVDGVARTGVTAASAAAGNVDAGMDTTGGDAPADDGNGDEDDSNSEEIHDDDDEDADSAGGSEDDKYEGCQLLEWPHRLYEDCVCWDETLANMDFEEFYVIFRDRSDMDKEQMREYHGHLWEHRGVPLGWRETLPWKLYNKPGMAGIRYHRYTLRELKTFVVDRGLRDPYPAGLTLKTFYVPLLEKDDRSKTFRFMDLPPELRINVCRLLFTVNLSCNWRMDVAVLRTCRQVYEEARDLPYSEPTNVVFCDITQGATDIRKLISVGTGFERFDGDHGRYYRIPRAIDDFPAHFRLIQRLEISLIYTPRYSYPREAVDANGWPPLNQFLFGLSSFLMEGHRLKHFHLRLDLPEVMEDSALEKCLYPLRRIRNVTNVTFEEGALPEYIVRKLTSDMSGSEPVFNTMRQWKLLQEEASAQMSLFEEMGCFECDCGECTPGARAEQIIFRLQSLTEAKQKSCFDSAHEENFLARLGMLKRTLQLVDIDHLKKQVQALAEKRKATKKYDRTTDDERLEEAIRLWGREIYEDDLPTERANHDWSDDDDDDEAVEAEKAVLHDPNNQQSLGTRDIASIFEHWAPDATMEEQAASPSPQATGSRPISAASSQFTVPDGDF